MGAATNVSRLRCEGEWGDLLVHPARKLHLRFADKVTLTHSKTLAFQCSHNVQPFLAGLSDNGYVGHREEV